MAECAVAENTERLGAMRYLSASGQRRQVALFARDNNRASTAALTVAVALAIDRLVIPPKRAGRLKKRERKTQRTVESSTEKSVVVDAETFRAPWSHVPTTPFSPRIRPQPGAAATGTVEVENTT